MHHSLIDPSHSKKFFGTLAILASCLLIISCKSGYNTLYEQSNPDENAPECAATPSNNNLNTAAIRVFDLITDLSCERIENFVLSGQSLGFGNEISGNNSYRNYSNLVENLAANTTKTVAIASIDYEKTALFTSGELDEANAVLIRHSNNSGLVSISWTPQNPWARALDDKLSPTDNTDLAVLYGDDTQITEYVNFNERLTLVIDKLNDLQEQGVSVIFSPFPEMNTTAYWYGAHDNNTEAKFRALWAHVYNRVNAETNNVIWAYAPRSGTTAVRVSALWGYPTNLDIIAAVSYSDEASILDYDRYRDQNKPMGMTRLSPATSDGTFDNRLYASELLERYPFIAYWIADHDTDNSNQANTDNIQRSIIRNLEASALMNNASVASTQTIIDEQWLSN